MSQHPFSEKVLRNDRKQGWYNVYSIGAYDGEQQYFKADDILTFFGCTWRWCLFPFNIIIFFSFCFLTNATIWSYFRDTIRDDRCSCTEFCRFLLLPRGSFLCLLPLDESRIISLKILILQSASWKRMKIQIRQKPKATKFVTCRLSVIENECFSFLH